MGMFSEPVGALSPRGIARDDPVETVGIVGGDDVPSKPVYPGIIDLIAATAAGLNAPYGDAASIPLLDGNPKCPGDGPDSLRLEDGDRCSDEGERDLENELS